MGEAIRYLDNIQHYDVPGDDITDLLDGIKTCLLAADWTSTSLAAYAILSGGNPSNGQTFTVDGRTYTWAASLDTDAVECVKIGATMADSVDNARRALNLEGTTLVNYRGISTAHATVTASNPTSTTLQVTAQTAGPAGNAIIVSNSGGPTWDAGNPGALYGGGYALDSDGTAGAQGLNYRLSFKTNATDELVVVASDTDDSMASDEMIIDTTVPSRRYRIHADPTFCHLYLPGSAAQRSGFTSGTGWVPEQFTGVAITGAEDDGGLIKITTGAAHGMVTGAQVYQRQVGGVPDANGTFTITVIDTTHYTLDDSTFAGSYTSGGLAAFATAGQVVFCAFLNNTEGTVGTGSFRSNLTGFVNTGPGPVWVAVNGQYLSMDANDTARAQFLWPGGGTKSQQNRFACVAPILQWAVTATTDTPLSQMFLFNHFITCQPEIPFDTEAQTPDTKWWKSHTNHTDGSMAVREPDDQSVVTL
jgi:hypothetical protein